MNKRYKLLSLAHGQKIWFLQPFLTGITVLGEAESMSNLNGISRDCLRADP